MFKRNLSLLAVASVVLLVPSVSRAETILQNFAGDPLTNGWSVFGDASLFVWDSTNQNLRVTWDSTRSNTYFHYPFGTVVTRYDDFSFSFDLRLSDIVSGVETNKTGPIQLGFGFLKSVIATNTSYVRNAYGQAPNVAGFDYYAWGYFDFGGTIYESPAATTPAFISGVNSFAYSPAYVAVYNNELPTNQTVQVTMTYTASNQTAVIIVLTNGVPTATLPDLVLNSANGFADTDDFFVDMFSISSFSSIGDDYNSILAHGTVDNLVVTLPPPVQNVAGSFSNGVWQVEFDNRRNWLYTLQRTTNFVSWTDASAPISGNGTNLFLQDTNAVSDRAWYRVHAARP